VEGSVVTQDEVGLAGFEDILGDTPVFHDEDAGNVEFLHHMPNDVDVDTCGQTIIVQKFIGWGVPVTGDDQRPLSGISVGQSLCSRLKYNGQQQKDSSDISFHKAMH
jgi:hypothetical protein